MYRGKDIFTYVLSLNAHTDPPFFGRKNQKYHPDCKKRMEKGLLLKTKKQRMKIVL
jgi:hypothetical protein